MAIWRKADVRIRLDDEATSYPVATIVADTPAGPLRAMANVVRVGKSVHVTGLHAHGDRTRANAIGAANIMLLIQAFMEELDVDEVVVTGGLRTTGANPGKTPRPARFTRRLAP